jgi:transposase-like protein
VTNASASPDPLDALVELMREQLRWNRASAIPAVRSALDTTLASTAMRRAYELCDGSRTFREVSRDVGVGIGTLSRWGRSWREQGLAFEDAGGRLRHLVALEALGLPIDIDEPARRARSPRGGEHGDG